MSDCAGPGCDRVAVYHRGAFSFCSTECMSAHDVERETIARVVAWLRREVADSKARGGEQERTRAWYFGSAADRIEAGAWKDGE